MPVPTGHGVLIPSDLIGQVVAPSQTTFSTFTNLASGGTVTLGSFPSASQPAFYVSAFIVSGIAAGLVVATLQPQITLNGTARNVGAAYNIVEAEQFQLPVSPDFLVIGGGTVQWVLTITGANATTTLELVITSR